MTVDEFVAEVRALNLKWHKSGAVIRCESSDCPLVALVRAKGIVAPKIKWTNADFREAAENLGINYDDGINIAEAADHEGKILRPQIEMLLEV